METVAGVQLEPVFLGDTAIVANAARTGPHAVVLRAAVHVVRLPHIDRHLVELPERHPVLQLPGAAGVVRKIDAAVVPQDDVL